MRSKSLSGPHTDVSSCWLRITEILAHRNISWIYMCVFILPILVLLPSLGAFPYPASGSQFSDLTISHYPNAEYLRDSILTTKVIPLWSTTILSGYPFVANPLSGLWYPVGWLALLIPLPLGFNLLVGLHLIWGGLGLYFLLRREGLDHIPALFAGTSFALLPKFFAHYGAGHLTLLYAVPWTPWLLFSEKFIVNSTNDRYRYRVPPSFILAIIFLADVRWGVFATLVWWVYSIFNRETQLLNTIFRVISQTGLALLLIAPMLLPMLEYSSLSTRSAMNPEDVLVYSFPLVQLLGLIFPNVDGYHEWVVYPGVIILVFAIVAIGLKRIRRYELFWIGLVALSTLTALGEQIPGFRLLARLPIVNLLRVPSRALFLTGLGLAVLAGYGIQKLVVQSQPLQIIRLRLILFSLLVFSMLLGSGIYLINNNLPEGILWGLGILVMGIFWIEIRFRKKLTVGFWFIGLFFIGFIDQGIVDLFSYKVKAAEEVFDQGAEVARYISSQEGIHRTYSPSYSIPQHTAIQYELQLADGVDPMQLDSYVDFMQEATGVPQTGYSVTLPPFESGDPALDNKFFIPDAEKLGILNVGFVVADYDINSAGLILEAQFNSMRIYRNTQQMPRAWIQRLVDKQEMEFKSVEVLELMADRIRLLAEGPGTLILSEIDYPGWKVWVDGEVSLIYPFQDILRSVPLERGVHEVTFVFQPTSLYIGMLLCIPAMIYLVMYFIFKRRLV